MLAHLLWFVLARPVVQAPLVEPLPGERLAALVLDGTRTQEERLRELATLSDLEPELWRCLEDWTLPGAAGEPASLDESARAFVRAALLALPRERWSASLASLGQSEDAAQLRAGLRLVGTLGGRTALTTLHELGGRACASGRFDSVAEAYEEGLGLRLAQDPKTLDALRTPPRSLASALLDAQVRVLSSRPSAATFECLLTWLGQNAELDASLLLALGNMVQLASAPALERFVIELERAMEDRRPAVLQAAATALGRIARPESAPWLIELLEHEDPAVQRVALGSLRALGGVRLPGLASSWRSWYAREETWYQLRAQAVVIELQAALAQEDPSGAVRTLLRELGAHRLHRESLVGPLRRLLEDPRASLRVLGCQGLERLGAQRGRAWLVTALDDQDPGVVSAAQAALRALEGVDLGSEPGPWRARLGLEPPGALVVRSEAAGTRVRE